MISARNTTRPGNNCDLHDAVRDYGPEPIDAKTAMGAANLAEVMAESRSRLKVRAALLVGLLSASDLMEPEEHEV